MIDYSVIVPAYQACEVLPWCLTALHHQTIDPARYEIIIVDDGSTDDTVRVAENAMGSPPVQVVRAVHAGPAHARNLGAQAAQGDLLLFTDADCEPASDWIEKLTQVFTQTKISGAKGVYRTHQTSLVARFVQQEYQDKYDRLLTQDTIDFIDTYSAAYRRDVFLANGGFDVTFNTASVEDQEFSFRLAEQGLRLVFAPEAVVYHQHDESVREYARRKYRIGYWKALVLKQHPGKAVRDSHTPQVIKVQMALFAAALISSLSALFIPSGWPIAIALWWALGLTMLPLLIKIARRDAPVLWIALWLMLVRAISLGLGLAIGLLRFNLLAKRS